MPKRLILVRHATAQSYASGGDFERHLTDYGREQALKLGLHLAEFWNPAGMVWVSPAKRTLETLDEISKSLAFKSQIQDLSVYEGGARNLLELISVSEDDHVMIVGHEPNISHTAAFLVSDGSSMANRFTYGVRTATGIVLDFPSETKELVEGSASLVEILQG